MGDDIVGIFAILCTFGTPVAIVAVYMLTKSRERIALMKMQTSQTANEDVNRKLDALRQEISRLRDTCTQFDVSHDNALERLEQRVNMLESRLSSTISTPGEPPRVQRIEQR